MGGPRWCPYSPGTRSGPAVAWAMGNSMEQAKVVGEKGRHWQKGSGNNSRTRRCRKGRQVHITKLKADVFATVLGAALHPQQQSDERQSQSRACHRGPAGDGHRRWPAAPALDPGIAIRPRLPFYLYLFFTFLSFRAPSNTLWKVSESLLLTRRRSLIGLTVRGQTRTHRCGQPALEQPPK